MVIDEERRPFIQINDFSVCVISPRHTTAGQLHKSRRDRLSAAAAVTHQSGKKRHALGTPPTTHPPLLPPPPPPPCGRNRGRFTPRRTGGEREERGRSRLMADQTVLMSLQRVGRPRCTVVKTTARSASVCVCVCVCVCVRTRVRRSPPLIVSEARGLMGF